MRTTPGAAVEGHAPATPLPDTATIAGTPIASPAAADPGKLADTLDRRHLPDELDRLLELLADADRLQARIVDLVGHLQVTGIAEESTGVPLELWLSARGRRTRSDRRMLATAADTLERLPSLRDAFARGDVSWSQVRAVTLRCERLPSHLCDAIDEALARELNAFVDTEPEALVHAVSQALAAIESSNRFRVRSGPSRRFLHLQPELDQGGGRIYGELDPIGFAVLAQATEPGPPPHATARRQVGDTGEAGVRDGIARTQARRRADRLVDLLARSLTDEAPPGSPARQVTLANPSAAHPDAHGDAEDGLRASATRAHAWATRGLAAGGADELDTEPEALPVAPTLLLTMSLDTLLGRDDTPAALLANVLGGRVRVPTDVARRLADRNGVSVRGIVVDDTGRVLGVGRRRRQPPGWVRDAILARDAVCAEPACERSALRCDLDHVRAWVDGGGTDVDNLQPLCAAVNRRLKASWRVQVEPDGSRRWFHPRTGLTVRTVPTARRLGIEAGPDPPHDHDGRQCPASSQSSGAASRGGRNPRPDPAHRVPPPDPRVPF
jgi:hypothetical protein